MTARDRAVGDVMPRQVTPRFKAPKVAKKRKPKSAKARADELWGAVIHLRDDRCRFCGKRDGKLDAHHVMIRSFLATRTDTNNGLLLCWPRCHQDIAHGDPTAAVNHYSRIYGLDGYNALRAKAYDGRGKKYPESFWRAEVERLELELAQQGLRHG